MRTSRSIELLSARSTASGSTVFSEPLASDETLIAEVRSSDRGELFCHRFQTDQLQVISGIPPGVPHGAINRSSRPAVVVNAVLRHGASDPRDYRPRAIPRALAQVWSELQAA